MNRSAAATGSSPPGRWWATGSAQERRAGVGEALGHLGRGQPLAVAEVELAQPLVDLQREAGDVAQASAVRRARLSGDDHTAASPAVRAHAASCAACSLPARGERHVADAGVAVLRVPHGLAVAHEDEVGHRAFSFAGLVPGVAGGLGRQPAAVVPARRRTGRTARRTARRRRGAVRRPRGRGPSRRRPPRRRGPATAASTAMPRAGSGVLGQGDRAAEDVGAQPAPVRAARRAAGQHEVAVERGAQQVEVVEAQPLDERDALQHGGEPVAVVGGRAEQEPLAPAGRRTGSARRSTPAGRPAPPTGSYRAACRFRSSRSAPGKSREIAPAPVLDAPPGSQSPLGALCEYTAPERVADQLPRHPLEHQRRAEHGVPAARAQHPGAELGGAAVGGPGDDRGAGRAGRCPPRRRRTPCRSGSRAGPAAGARAPARPARRTRPSARSRRPGAAPVLSALLRSVATGRARRAGR